MKALLAFFAACIFAANPLQAQNFEWAKSFGSVDTEEGNSIAVDANGNVYSTGYFRGTADLNPGVGTSNSNSVGANDVYIQKLDSAGNFLWAKTVGGSSDDVGYSISVDESGNVFATGYFQGTVDFNPGPGTSDLTSAGAFDIFILKLDASGNFVWARSFGNTLTDMGYSIACDGSGNVLATGIFSGTVDFNPGAGTNNLTAVGAGDIFILKLDPSGNFQWAKSAGGLNFDYGRSIKVDASGNVHTTGYFEGTVDFNPGAGTSNLSSMGGGDAFVQKLDASGNFLWAISFGGATLDQGHSISIDDAGNVITSGQFNGTVDFDPGTGISNLIAAGGGDVFVQKMDSSGNFLWAKAFGNAQTEVGHSCAVDAVGNVYTTGYFSGTVDFDPGAGSNTLTSAGSSDVFIHKMDASGNFIWAKSFGSTISDRGISIKVDAKMNIYTTGYFFGTVDFDPGAGTQNLTSVGSWDVFVHKMIQCIPNSGIDTRVACSSFTWINGTTYTSSNNTATHILTNAGGCDSVVTLNLTINQPSVGTDTRVACGSFTWINGVTYTSSNTTATHTLTNSLGCDSVVTLNLTINQPSVGTDTRVACGSFTWINGVTYTATNTTATHTLTNALGCDSVVTLNLTIQSVSDLTTTLNGVTITANNTNAVYRWLDCGNNFAVIPGETNQAFTATANGNYAVELTENGCVDTSACVAITTLGIGENHFGNQIHLSPNPTQGDVSVNLGRMTEKVYIQITDLNGKVISRQVSQRGGVVHLKFSAPAGLYHLTIRSKDKIATFRLVRE